MYICIPSPSVIKEKVGVMVFYVTFNNISDLLVEKTGVPGENNRSAASHVLCMKSLKIPNV
jgi:hypothetical protein